MSIQNQPDHQNTPVPANESKLVIEEDENAHDSFQNIPLLDGIVMDVMSRSIPRGTACSVSTIVKAKGTEVF